MKRNIVSGFIIAWCFIIPVSAQTFANGYTDKLSYRGEEIVTFYLSGFNCDNQSCDVPIRPIGEQPVANVTFNTNVPLQPIQNSQPLRDGFGYSPTIGWTVPTNLRSGYYLLGDQIPFIIKGDKNSEDIVVVVPTNTHAAYNIDPYGNNLYSPGVTETSFLRPLNKVAKRQYFEEGFLKWVKQWGEAHNYVVNFISDVDMEDFSEIQNAKMIIIPGHSEYWTRQARLNFDRFVDEGKDALVLSGNTMWWQVRYENNNTQMICDRGAAWDNNAYENDQIADPLLRTYHWNEPTLKYSILGSIGSDSHRGGFGVDTDPTSPCYGGFNGYRITLENSPILAGLNFSFHETLSFPTDEYDGTLVVTDDFGNYIPDQYGDPQLDISALGFYRAEMIGYDQITEQSQIFYHDPNALGIPHFCPFMVFQKTASSGTIINVNSNEWCSNWVIYPAYNQHGDACPNSIFQTDSRVPLITENMITLMLNDQNSQLHGNNLFYNPPPTSFIVKPSYTNVSYNACGASGSIRFTPDGVYLTDAYKVDHGFTWDFGIPADQDNNRFSANFDETCSNYNNGLRQAGSEPEDEQNISNGITTFFLYPNPAKENCTLSVSAVKGTDMRIVITDVLGNTLYDQNSSVIEGSNTITINTSTFSSGIYNCNISVNGQSVRSQKLVVVK